MLYSCFSDRPIFSESLVRMKNICAALPVALLLAVAAACVKTEKSSNPLGPSVAGPIPGVSITSPNPLNPPQGSKIPVGAQPLTLSLENATTSGVRPLTYAFEIANDSAFTNLVFTREGVAPGGNGRTELRLPDPLAPERNYYWRARAQDGANTGPYTYPIVFNIFTPVVLGAPRLLAPIGQIAELNPRYSLANASRSGPVGPIRYVIELAADVAFGNRLAIWEVPEQPVQTNLDNLGQLPANAQFYWRARATDSANNSGPWSQVEAFRTPAVSTPSGPQAPGTSCGPPYPSTALGIVECRRSQWDHIPHDQIAGFLRGVAQDLNSAGIAGGPFGILRKTGGANCSGYSCDIICAGQGNAQRQWDVLGDVDGAQTPGWLGPKTVPDIRVDICEIQ